MLTKRRLPVAGLVAGTMLAPSGAAFAGSCPADKVVADGQGQKPSAAARQGRHRHRAGRDRPRRASRSASHDRQFRMRRLAIKPGGIVPWHSHDDRPALIYVAVGEVTEYASNCAVPIVHKPGEVAEEIKGTSHWWQNTGKTHGRADLRRPPAPDRRRAHDVTPALVAADPPVTPGREVGRHARIADRSREQVHDHDEPRPCRRAASRRHAATGACGATW